MRMIEWLQSEEGKQFLIREYSDKVRKMTEIAVELTVHPMMIRRALAFHHIPIRGKNNKKRKPMSAETKLKISKGRKKAWQSAPPEEKKALSEIAKKQWDARSEIEKKNFSHASIMAIRETSKKGSKLERQLSILLRNAGYRVDYHQRYMIEAEELEIDMVLPDLKVAIEIDGVSHFKPIWGKEKLRRSIEADNRKNGLINRKGFIVIRVQNHAKEHSDALTREAFEKITEVLRSLHKQKFIVVLKVGC